MSSQPSIVAEEHLPSRAHNGGNKWEQQGARDAEDPHGELKVHTSCCPPSDVNVGLKSPPRYNSRFVPGLQDLFKHRLSELPNWGTTEKQRHFPQQMVGKEEERLGSEDADGFRWLVVWLPFLAFFH